MFGNDRQLRAATPMMMSRSMVLIACIMLLCTGSGCRRQAEPGPARYEREIEIDRAAAIREKSGRSGTGVTGRYPWQGRGDPGIESLPQRVAEMESSFKRESDVHHQVLYGRRDEKQ